SAKNDRRRLPSDELLMFNSFPGSTGHVLRGEGFEPEMSRRFRPYRAPAEKLPISSPLKKVGEPAPHHPARRGALHAQETASARPPRTARGRHQERGVATGQEPLLVRPTRVDRRSRGPEEALDSAERAENELEIEGRARPFLPFGHVDGDEGRGHEAPSFDFL